jgi:hypothetical protein
MSQKRRPAASLQEWQRRRMEDPVEQALRTADLLLQSGGFGMVALDLAGVPVKMARRIPLTTWFRFRRAVENKPTILLVVGIQPCAESCASLSLKLSHPSSVFSRQQEILGSKEVPPSHAELFTGIEVHAEVLRSRCERKSVQSVGAFGSKTAWTA